MKKEKYKFWVYSSRHPRVEEIINISVYKEENEEDKKCRIKDQLESWCEEHYENWNGSEVLIRYGYDKVE
jgi:hypothetical protein